jgi:hypothetical protein
VDPENHDADEPTNGDCAVDNGHCSAIGPNGALAIPRRDRRRTFFHRLAARPTLPSIGSTRPPNPLGLATIRQSPDQAEYRSVGADAEARGVGGGFPQIHRAKPDDYGPRSGRLFSVDARTNGPNRPPEVRLQGLTYSGPSVVAHRC